LSKLLKIYKRFLGRPNSSPILIFGNQKSGTSAIASLLADYAGCTKTIDIPELWPPMGKDILIGRKDFSSCFPKLNYQFSSDIVKEPMMTFFLRQVLDHFPHGKGVFIVRDPRDNIRSLLNRRKLPGDLASIKGHEMAKGKTLIGDPDLWELNREENNYIDQMALRWNHAFEQYLKSQGELTLVKYEDFMADKMKFIEELAIELSLSKQGEIFDKVDVQYQPSGNKNVTWIDFFGSKNLNKIEAHCGKYFPMLDYPQIIS